MPKSDEELMSGELHKLFYKHGRIKEFGLACYRLAESEKESNYRKLVDGLRREIEYQSKLGSTEVTSLSIESLITEIEGESIPPMEKGKR